MCCEVGRRGAKRGNAREKQSNVQHGHCPVRMSKLSLAEMVCFFMNATMHMVSECMNNVSVRISYICTLVLMPVYV